jgi:hypothetical protein
VKILTPAAACAMLIAAPALASGPQRAVTSPVTPSASEIIARYEQFLGGAPALARIETRTVRSRRIATIGENTDEAMVRQSKRPMQSIMYHETIDGTFERYTNGCDGASNWTGYAPREGADDGAPHAGQASTDGVCQQELYYYGYFPLDRAGMEHNVARFEVHGQVTIVPADPGAFAALAGGKGPDLVPAGPRATWLVLSVPARPADTYAWLYFDSTTGALLRRAEAGRGAAPIPPGLSPRYTDFVDYREVGDGTRAPFQFVSFAPNAVQRGIHTSIRDNIPLDDAVFARPRDVRLKSKGL